jgi:hypothetical protein
MMALFFSTAHATVWYVHPDSTLNSIQVALDGCSANDTVLVGPGVYYENIQWPSTQGLDLISELGPGSTTIDGDSLGRVINVPTIQDTTTVIKGFTIQHGHADRGAGIRCSNNSSPIIYGNIIVDNFADSIGGGISMGYSSPIIDSNTITENTSVYGGGIGIGYTSYPTIKRNSITYNSAWQHGGGIVCGYNSSMTADNNTIRNNSATHQGGGLMVFTDQSIISNCIIDSNTAQAGGGLALLNDSEANVTHSTIRNNTAYLNGGGIRCANYAIPNIEYCQIEYNSYHEIYCDDGANPRISYNNIVDTSWHGVYNNTASILVDAKSNWWGHATGPYHPVTNLNGQGCAVSDHVDFHPWLPQPGVEEYKTTVPLVLNLQVTPNPFTQITDIRYQITGNGEQHSRESTNLRIYDATGRLVRQWDRTTIRPSDHISWDGTDQVNRQLGSGVYFVKLTSGCLEEAKKVLLVR